MRGFWSIGPSVILSSERTLTFRFGPEQCAQRNQRAFLPGRGPEASIRTLARQQRRHSPANGRASFWSAEGKQRFQSVEEIGSGPGAVVGLLTRNHGGQPAPELGPGLADERKSMNARNDCVSSKVAAPIAPLLLQLQEAGEMAINRWP